jgi:hypothetical protein
VLQLTCVVSQDSRRRPRDLSEVKSKLSAEMKQKGDKSSSPVPEMNRHQLQPVRRWLVQQPDSDDETKCMIADGDHEDDEEEEDKKAVDEESSSDEESKRDSGDDGSSENEGDTGKGGDDFYQTTFAPTRQNMALVIEENDLEAFVTGLLKDWQYCNRPTVSSDVHLVATTTKKFVSGCRQVCVSGCLASNADSVERFCLALRGMYDEFTKHRGEDNRESQGIRGWMNVNTRSTPAESEVLISS